MALEVKLVDGQGTGLEAHLHKSNGDVGLKVFTEPLREKDTNFIFALNNDLGID